MATQLRLEAMRLASGYDFKSIEETLEMAEQIAEYLEFGPGGKPPAPSEASVKLVLKATRKKLTLPFNS